MYTLANKKYSFLLRSSLAAGPTVSGNETSCAHGMRLVKRMLNKNC